MGEANILIDVVVLLTRKSIMEPLIALIGWIMFVYEVDGALYHYHDVP